MKHYINVIKNYNYFDERTGRTEFWSFVSLNIVFAITAFWLDLIFNFKIGETNFGYLYIIYALFSFIPGIAVGIRRMHDIDKSGWNLLWAFVPLFGGIYLIYLCTIPSYPAENLYGNIPKQESFINSDSTNNKILFVLFSWIISTKMGSIIIQISNIDFYKSQYCLAYSGFVNLGWAVFPFVLAMLIKNKNWKIAAIIISILLLLHNFYDYIKILAMQSRYFQF